MLQVLCALIPLLESNRLFIAGRAEMIEASDGYNETPDRPHSRTPELTRTAKPT
jgi:hypothetical protein